MVIKKRSSSSCCWGSPETVEEPLEKPLSFCLITPVIIISSAKADFKEALKFLFSGLKEKRQPEAPLIWTSMWIPQNPIIPLLDQQFDQFSLFSPQGNNFPPLCMFSPSRFEHLSVHTCHASEPGPLLPWTLANDSDLMSPLCQQGWQKVNR